MSVCRSIIHAGVAIVACLPAALAQSTFPFQLLLQQDQTKVTVPNNSSITVRSGIGQIATIHLTVTYTGSTEATISSPQIYGSSDFTVAPLAGAPLVLKPNSSFVVTIQCKPSTTQSASAQLGIPWVETRSSSSQVAANGTIALTFTSAVANLSVYYSLPTNGNVVPLATGGTLEFPATTVSSSMTATVLIANLGSGQGTVNGVAVSGDAFQLVQLPLLPSGINPGSALSFGIMYKPQIIGTDIGTLTITLGAQTFTASLRGSGGSAVYSYSIVTDGQSTPVSSSGIIAFPDTAVSETTPIVLQIQNTGNAVGILSGLSISGTGFRVTEAPPFPLTLQVNGTAQLKVTFTPAQPGRLAGRLFIGSDYFDLVGTGLAPNLLYSYMADGVVTSIQPQGTVVFSPVPVSQSATIDFSVTNQGTAAAQITSIGIAGSTSGVFQLSKAPSLPVSLNGGQSITFSVRFAPATVSQATATLLVNTQAFPLLGFGTDPPKLPAYQITGISGQVAPYSQPAVSLALAQSYPAGLRGTLTLTGDSAIAGLDPAVQFSTGGRTVAFTIPAGQTQAVFINGLTRVQLQTGTIAGTITLTPNFLTDSGTDVTPANPQTLTVAVPSQAPTLLTAQIGSRSATSFTIVVTGYSTTRSLSAVDVQFTGSSDVTWNGARLTVSLSQAAGVWFGSPSSLAYGGLFSVAIPFSLQSSDSTLAINKLQSFSVTATNSVGTSAAVVGSFQ